MSKPSRPLYRAYTTRLVGLRRSLSLVIYLFSGIRFLVCCLAGFFREPEGAESRRLGENGKPLSLVISHSQLRVPSPCLSCSSLSHPFLVMVPIWHVVLRTILLTGELIVWGARRLMPSEVEAIRRNPWLANQAEP
jgi:hypothetical protein